jgi:hypothetical protein
LLAALDRSLGLTVRLAGALRCGRQQGKALDSPLDLMRKRVLGLAQDPGLALGSELPTLRLLENFILHHPCRRLGSRDIFAHSNFLPALSLVSRGSPVSRTLAGIAEFIGETRGSAKILGPPAPASPAARPNPERRDGGA